MPAPTPEAIQQSLTFLQDGSPLLQKTFFNVAWAFAHHPNQGQFLQDAGAANKKLAETLIVFRKSLTEAVAADAGLEPVINLAFLHYVINTDGRIPESES